ncbi:MAG: NUDIX domain-containing protein, partial [Chlamydiia bacterium]|nr:NUDIX domain-containing protein [Chlamydiia bacterium]
MKTHTGFYALIYQDSALLTILKSRGPYIDTYDLPGGRPEMGEEPFQTLQREVLEETGVLVMEATFYKTVTIQTEHLLHTAHFYKVSLFDASHFNPTPRLED